MGDSLTHARAAGLLLLEAKEGMAHGTFMKWVQRECQFSHSTANLYMRIAREWDQIEGNSQSIANLSLGAVGEWLSRRGEKSTPAPGGRAPDWAEHYCLLERRLQGFLEVGTRELRAFSFVLPTLDRLEADGIRYWLLGVKERADWLIARVDAQVDEQIQEAEHARLSALAVELGIMAEQQNADTA